jgi:hypothetical protein
MLAFYAVLTFACGLARAAEAVPVVPVGQNATLQVDSTKPGLAVGIIEGRSTGRGYVAGAGYATIHTTTYRDICMSPCKVELPPGMYEFTFHGRNFTRNELQVDMKAGQTERLSVDPGSHVVRIASYYGLGAGLLAVIYGGIFLPTELSAPPRERTIGAGAAAGVLGGGVALTGLSIWGLKASKTVVTENGPPSVSVAYSGTF